jgi:hypothetical protein
LRSAYPGIARFGAPALFWGSVTALAVSVFAMGGSQDPLFARGFAQIWVAATVGSGLIAGPIGFVVCRLSHPWWVWMLGWCAAVPVAASGAAIAVVVVGSIMGGDGIVLWLAAVMGGWIIGWNIGFLLLSLPVLLAIRSFLRRRVPTADPAARPLR